MIDHIYLSIKLFVFCLHYYFILKKYFIIIYFYFYFYLYLIIFNL